MPRTPVCPGFLSYWSEKQEPSILTMLSRVPDFEARLDSIVLDLDSADQHPAGGVARQKAADELLCLADEAIESWLEYCADMRGDARAESIAEELHGS